MDRNSDPAVRDRAAAPSGSPAQAKPVKPRSRYTAGNIVAMVLVLYLLGAFLFNVAHNRNFQWDVVGHYLMDASILAGLLRTIGLTVVAVSMGLLLGVVIALLNLSRNPVLAGIGRLYVWFFRGTPLLVQLIFWFNLSALYPRLSLSLGFGTSLGSVDTNTVITPFVAALLGLGLHAAGYIAEIVRGGILAVGKTQREAASALGMGPFTQFRKIIWPQAFRIILPALGNRFIAELKDTSLVSVIAIPDLLYSAQLIYSQNYQTIPLLLVATIWYLIAVTVLTFIQKQLERRAQPTNGARQVKKET